MHVLVDDEQLFDAALMQDLARIGFAGADRDRRQILAGHETADRLAWISRKAHVAVRQNPAKLADFSTIGMPLIRLAFAARRHRPASDLESW